VPARAQLTNEVRQATRRKVLSYRRHVRKLTQDEAAHEIGIPVATLRAVESGRSLGLKVYRKLTAWVNA
jgi:DNA-binding XRE family transcriptional regulator